MKYFSHKTKTIERRLILQQLFQSQLHLNTNNQELRTIRKATFENNINHNK